MISLKEIQPQKGTKLALLSQEANNLVNQRYLLAVKLRVNKRMNADDKTLAAIEAQISEIVQYMEELEKEIIEVEREV